MEYNVKEMKRETKWWWNVGRLEKKWEVSGCLDLDIKYRIWMMAFSKTLTKGNYLNKHNTYHILLNNNFFIALLFSFQRLDIIGPIFTF